MRDRFVQVGAKYSAPMTWDRYDVQKPIILTDVVINSRHIEPRQFIEDASEIVLERVWDIIHNNIKLNTVFNGEYVSGNKSVRE